MAGTKRKGRCGKGTRYCKYRKHCVTKTMKKRVGRCHKGSRRCVNQKCYKKRN